MTGSGFSGGSGAYDGVNSPIQKRKTLPSPWAQVVRGEHESIATVHQLQSPPSSSSSSSSSSIAEQSSCSDCSPRKVAVAAAGDNSAMMDSSETNNGNGGKPKKLAWNKPLNGVMEASPVMGGISWPALSESTKPSPKSSSAPVGSDGSMPTSQGLVSPHSPHKQGTSNARSNSTLNHTLPAGQRSMKRRGGGNSSGGGHSQSSYTHPSQPSPFRVFAIPQNGYANMLPTMPDQSPREPHYRGNNWEPRPVAGFVPPLHAVNEHRHSSRRGNFGPRGDGTYHNNLGGKRDQDRGHYGNARDVHVQPQRASPRGFVRHSPPNTATFVPQPVRPFANPMGYPDLLYIPTLPLGPFRGSPFFANAPATGMMMPIPEPPLPAMLVHQIEYYFSDENLIKDEFLKSNMDDQGWVPITLIAGFNRVKNMTSDIQLILYSLRTSTVLEVQDDKVRRRNDWMKWTLGSSRLAVDLGLRSSSISSNDMLTTAFQNITVEDTANNQNSTDKSSPLLEDVPRRHFSE